MYKKLKTEIFGKYLKTNFRNLILVFTSNLKVLFLSLISKNLKISIKIILLGVVLKRDLI